MKVRYLNFGHESCRKS